MILVSLKYLKLNKTKNYGIKIGKLAPKFSGAI